jgi:type I restriction enzyme S subunit
MLNLNTKIIGGIRIPHIPMQTQETIVSILSAYDDLIENNRRRIQLLEQAARLLYRVWFVHLRFPGHEHVAITDGVPEGWENGTVADFLLRTSSIQLLVVLQVASAPSFLRVTQTG